MTTLERMVAAEHERQENERMSEIHEGLSRAAHDVGELFEWFVCDMSLEAALTFAEVMMEAGRTSDAEWEGHVSRLGAWRAAWGGR